MLVAIVLVILLPAIRCEYEEMQLITQLTEYFHFDHHFFLLDFVIDTSQFISTDGLTPQTVCVVKEDEQDIEFVMNSKNCFMIVASNTTEFEHTISLLNVVKAIRIYQKHMKVGVFFPQKASVDDLRKLFEWCIDNQITDIFAASYFRHDFEQCAPNECRLNIFTFRPFKTASEPVNVTSGDRFDDYFQSTNANFYQRKLRYEGTMSETLSGTLWSTVFDLMNASFVEVDNNYKTVHEALENGIDVLNTTYVPQNNEEHLDVYPVQMREYVVLVPESLPYSEFSSYLINGMSGDFFIYSILSTSGSIVVLVFLRYTKRKRILILQSVADVFNLLLNENGHIKYQQLFRAEIFIIVPLTFVGFILVNGILSNLKSHLTRPALQPQIDTAEDIYRSKVQIITHTNGWKAILINLFSNQTKYSKNEWDERIVVDEESTIIFVELNNRTNAFLLGSDVADILLRTQKRLNLKGYHRSHIQTSKLLFTYMVHRKFLFFERLNEIILTLKSAGLYDLWQRRYCAVLESSVLKYNLVRLQWRETYVERFEFPIFIVYGWFAGFVVLIFEIAWQKFKGKST